MGRRCRYKPSQPGHKVCTKCRREKPLADFAPHPITKDGRNSWCRDCARPQVAEQSRRFRSRTNNPPRMDGSKVCSACRIDTPRTEFTPNRYTPDGRHWYCRPCAAKKGRVRRAKEKTQRITIAETLLHSIQDVCAQHRWHLRKPVATLVEQLAALL